MPLLLQFNLGFHRRIDHNKQMSPALILACVGGYFAFLLLIAWFTSRNASNASYFLGNKSSPWYAVAFGLIGDSLSGVTFISVPGQVGVAKFSYLQMVLGYVVGYLVISVVLLPVYYRMNLTSIYSFLRERVGPAGQKMGSIFFLLSRLLGAAARLYLAVRVLQLFVFDALGIPFVLSVTLTIALILAYTYKGGIKTLVWTDTFQSAFLLLGVALSVFFIGRELGLGLGGIIERVRASELSQTFFWDWKPANNFWKQFIGGAFVAICMTGLDQNMMQKNLSCRSLADARKNIHWFAAAVVFVNLLFLALGVLLYEFARAKGVAIPAKTDHLFPMLALQHLGPTAAIVFVLGLTAATFSSADSVLTTLTTSFCIDILGMDQRGEQTEARQTRTRHLLHIAFAAVLLGCIVLIDVLNQDSVISLILKVASFTYGPILGLFAFALFCRRAVPQPWVIAACVIAPLVCWMLNQFSSEWFDGYAFSNELLILNGALTLGLLLLGSRKTSGTIPFAAA